MSLLYDRYYDRAETLEVVTDFEVIEEPEPEPCEDGTMPPCQTDTTNPGENNNGENNNGNDNDQTTNPGENNDDDNNDATTKPPVDTSQAEEEDIEGQALVAFFALIAIMLVTLYFVSRGGEDALAAEVQIEKMWDEQEAAALAASAFVPAPPPMAPPADESE
jgi:hypothetical protein